jgi:hypothetical protein
MTIGEVLVYTVVAGMVMVSLYGVMARQGRGYTRQISSMDADESARDAAAVLAWDIRHAAMAGDQLITPLASDSIVLLSVQGVGVVCDKHASQPRYAIWKTGGSMDSTINDSAMVYRVATSEWKAARISGVNTGSYYGMTSCAWTSTRAPDLVMVLSPAAAEDTAGIEIGSPVRAFRRVTYKAFTSEGRTWLGRKIGAGSYEKMTGPLRSSGGLSFGYYDINGVATTSPTDVRLVKFTVRTESYKQYRDKVGTSAYRYDSVSTAIALRR